MFQSPGSTLFIINNFPIHYYSICIAIAIICGSATSWWITYKYYPHMDPDDFYNFTPPIVLGGVIGARLYYVMLTWDYFSKHLNEIIMIWNGGMAIHGAIAGGLIVGLIISKVTGKGFIENCDAAPWGIIVGQTVGRWGNFFNSEAYGRPTELPWKLYIAPEYRIAGFEDYEFFHPTFLYESICNFIIFLLLFFVFRKMFQNVRGGVFFMYLILYSIGRILVESIRLDTVSFVHGIPLPTFVSILTIIAAGGVLVYITINRDKFKKQGPVPRKAFK